MTENNVQNRNNVAQPLTEEPELHTFNIRDLDIIALRVYHSDKTIIMYKTIAKKGKSEGKEVKDTSPLTHSYILKPLETKDDFAVILGTSPKEYVDINFVVDSFKDEPIMPKFIHVTETISHDFRVTYMSYLDKNYMPQHIVKVGLSREWDGLDFNIETLLNQFQQHRAELFTKD